MTSIISKTIFLILVITASGFSYSNTPIIPDKTMIFGFFLFVGHILIPVTLLVILGLIDKGILFKNTYRTSGVNDDLNNVFYSFIFSWVLSLLLVFSGITPLVYIVLSIPTIVAIHAVYIKLTTKS